MIEKVARAMFDKACPGIRYHSIDEQWYKEMARAAIEAMRLAPDNPLAHDLMRHADHDVWYWHNQMIDAALKE